MAIMAEPKTVEKLRQRRLDRMRLGQAVCQVETLVSDPEIRVALIPLTEAEYDIAMQMAAAVNAPENIAGAALRDRREQREVLVYSLRSPDNLDQRLFDSDEELSEVLEAADVTHLSDAYLELMQNSAPSIGILTDEELSDLKKDFRQIRLNELSGRQWYALRRFLLTLTPEQLTANSPGSS